jgi:hypothetical protein
LQNIATKALYKEIKHKLQLQHFVFFTQFHFLNA